IDDLRDGILLLHGDRIGEWLRERRGSVEPAAMPGTATIGRSEPPAFRSFGAADRRSAPNSHPVVRSRRPSRRPDLSVPKPPGGAAVKDARRAPRLRGA